MFPAAIHLRVGVIHPAPLAKHNRPKPAHPLTSPVGSSNSVGDWLFQFAPVAQAAALHKSNSRSCSILHSLETKPPASLARAQCSFIGCTRRITERPRLHSSSARNPIGDSTSCLTAAGDAPRRFRAAATNQIGKRERRKRSIRFELLRLADPSAEIYPPIS